MSMDNLNYRNLVQTFALFLLVIAAILIYGLSLFL